MSIINGAASVYSGPSSSGLFPQVETIPNGKKVTAVFREAGWIFIEYSTTGSNKKKCGYVLSSNITLTENITVFTSERSIRYVNSNTQTYFGPLPNNYEVAGSVTRCESVTYLGRKENGLAFIEYSVGAQRKRAYVVASYLSTTLMFNYSTFKQGDTIPNTLPMAGASVSQGFNDKSTNHKGHLGYDLVGITHAKPLFSGTVVAVNTSIAPASGRAVCIRHTIHGIAFYSTYCHLASVSVSVDDTVTTNTILGKIGGSGYNSENSYAVHLHVCTYTGSASSNPMGYCGGGTKTFEQTSSYANEYYYGSDQAKFPNCGGLCFYNPYGVVTSDATVMDAYHP